MGKLCGDDNHEAKRTCGHNIITEDEGHLHKHRTKLFVKHDKSKQTKLNKILEIAISALKK